MLRAPGGPSLGTNAMYQRVRVPGHLPVLITMPPHHDAQERRHPVHQDWWQCAHVVQCRAINPILEGFMALARRNSRYPLRSAVSIGTHRRCCPYASMKRSTSGCGLPAHLQLMGSQKHCTRASMSGMCVVGILSSRGLGLSYESGRRRPSPWTKAMDPLPPTL